MKVELPYVPGSYVPRRQAHALVWHHPTEPSEAPVFHTEGAFRVALARPLTASWFLAPFHSETNSLIVCTSPSAYPGNGETKRLLRRLCHEMVHCFNHEASRSTKILGDDHRDRHVSSWLDEGLALVVTARVTGRPAQIDCHADEPWDDDRLNRALDALDSEEREAAFAQAVRRVLELAKDHASLAACYGSLWR